MMNNKITNWWFGLHTSSQYLIWISTFCCMIASGVLFLILMMNDIDTVNLLMAVSSGIVFIVGFFTFVILFLTILWPNLKRKKNHQ